jgi:glutathione S-transferase
MLKLYGGQRSRAAIVQWYLEELGVPYEFVTLDMQAGEHRQPAYLAINPMGKVPALVEGELRLWESGAILLYLSDRYSHPPLTGEQRALLAQWVLFANATLGPGLFVESSRDKEMPKLLPPLNQILEHQPFLLGADFSAADVAVASLLGFSIMMLKLDFSAYPALMNYLQGMNERPAFQRAMGQSG